MPFDSGVHRRKEELKTGRFAFTRRYWLALTSILLFSLLISACNLQPTGQELVEKQCTQCHTLAPIEVKSRTRSEWEVIVYRMIANGAKLNKRQGGRVVDYLSSEYGPESP
jgi:hypothetical protein